MNRSCYDVNILYLRFFSKNGRIVSQIFPKIGVQYIVSQILPKMGVQYIVSQIFSKNWPDPVLALAPPNVDRWLILP